MNTTIIGGGIIGLCAAYYLQESGWKVTVMDTGDFRQNCSYGNMGMIVPSHFVPLAAPGIISQGIRWMFNGRSPFYVKPALNRQLISWGLQFIKNANAAHVAASAVPLRDLNLLSRHLYEQLAKQPGFGFGLERKGIIMYYKTAAVGEEEAHLAEKAAAMGLDAAVLNRADLQALEPQIEMDVLGGVHYRCDAHLSPHELMPQLITHLQRKGVQFLPNTKVTGIKTAQGKIKTVMAGTTAYESDLFVLAAGSWTPEVAQLAGIRIPMMPGKGYSVTLDAPKLNLNIPAILCEARVALTPMRQQLRYGGTMEVAAVNDRINMNRVAGIVDSVQQYFPNLPVTMPEKEAVWSGCRPCSPDGLPFIGYSQQYSNLLLAGGHAMMGLSLGPATGKLLAQLAGQQPTSVSLKAFSPARFR
ncbi:NAD(P)/FAD-dependent oxidoreductase [Chitinophaga nivalis]|uniref:FAD-dependent oxidoreductase n=1 Tax=Chitinophaga nivalis TaxID=2991709 RepID=A0ABT3IP03_9BACT|nr:FAD-dependent oxidoreductase [Chitinophaga nivalis]MCW3464641.1 FAD-dependent oxidoreductase [Chitinophaga nivalis]MCW3485668.1 FAD-dependent oxidoreductase [Chitinophaga nivalis]